MNVFQTHADIISNYSSYIRSFVSNSNSELRNIVNRELGRGKRWLSVDEIYKYPDVNSDTVYLWIDRFRMPAYRKGRLWNFKKDEVDEWVKAGGAADKTR